MAARKDPSRFEYTLKDSAYAAIVPTSGARYEFSERVSESSNNPNESSSVGQGSGPNPTHHTKKTREPSFSITMPIDEREAFEKWFNTQCAADGVCTLERRRKKTKIAPVVDHFVSWLPRFGEESFTDGEGVMVPVEGNYLEAKRDITNAIV